MKLGGKEKIASPLAALVEIKYRRRIRIRSSSYWEGGNNIIAMVKIILYKQFSTPSDVPGVV